MVEHECICIFVMFCNGNVNDEMCVANFDTLLYHFLSANCFMLFLDPTFVYVWLKCHLDKVQGISMVGHYYVHSLEIVKGFLLTSKLVLFVGIGITVMIWYYYRSLILNDT